jgi:hypothetical protein
VIAAWPSFSLIAAYELLMRQVRRAAETSIPGRQSRQSPLTRTVATEAVLSAGQLTATSRSVRPKSRTAGREMQVEAWRWALDNQAKNGSLPSGRDIGSQYGRHERWGRLVKRSGFAGELGREPEISTLASSTQLSAGG